MYVTCGNVFYSGGEAQPSFSGKHSNTSAKRLAFLEVPLGMSLRVEEKKIIIISPIEALGISLTSKAVLVVRLLGLNRGLRACTDSTPTGNQLGECRGVFRSYHFTVFNSRTGYRT